MRIFVAYGFNPRDSWIEPVIEPLIEAFGSEAVHGRELAGQLITDGVRQSIRNSDALIAFFTRRDSIGENRWSTHPWVRDELMCALENNKQVLEIYEEGVVRDAGMAGKDRQYLEYRESDRVGCVVGVVKVLGRWHRRGVRRFQLVPDSLLRPHLSKQYFRCRYRVMEGNNESPARDVPVQRIQGGLFITASDLSRDCLVQVEITTDEQVIVSDYTSIDSIAIQLSE
jgi:hypothetical protein